jgi:hypothetical protein
LWENQVVYRWRKAAVLIDLARELGEVHVQSEK